MITLQKAKKHTSFDFEVSMTKKIIDSLFGDLKKMEIVKSDIMSDEFDHNSFGIKINNMEIYYDSEKSEYFVFEEHYDAGNYWTPPDVQVEVAAIFATFGKALEFVIRNFTERSISDYMEYEYERYLDSLPQGSWYGA